MSPCTQVEEKCSFNCAECEYLTDVLLDEDHKVYIQCKLQEDKQ